MNSKPQSEIMDSETIPIGDLGPEFNRHVGAVWILSNLYFLVLGIVYWTDFYNNSLYLINYFATMTYFFIIFFSIKGNSFNEGKLIILVTILNLVFIAQYSYMFFLDHANFLPFQAVDAYKYDYYAGLIARGPIQDTFSGFPWYIANDDKGIIVYASLLYRIMHSTLTLNFFNILLNLATAVLLYRIGTFILSTKGAFLAAIIYGLATYTVFYEASGLKETLMIFLIVASFYFFVANMEKPRFFFFFLAILFCFLIGFFRVPIIFFVILAFAVVYFYRNNKNKTILSPIIFHCCPKVNRIDSTGCLGSPPE